MLALLMILVGLVAVKSLPVTQYPDITPPTVRVSAMYPGADAKTVAETVGIPIEEQVNGVEGMMYMSSNSGADGSYGLTVTFENGTDLDMATVKVQNRVALAESALPVSVRQQGVSVTGESTDIILFVAVEGDSLHRYDGLYLTNYARRNIVDELSRIDGVGGADAMGAGSYSMRVWLDPDVMRVRNVTPEDVMTAIRSQNMEVSAGSVGAPPMDGAQAFQLTLVSKGRLVSVDEFADIVIRSDGNNFLRLKDVAKIDLGSENYSESSLVSGKEAGLIAVYQTPGANALDVASRVKARLDELEPYFPEGIHYRVLMNTTDFVTSSIDDVLITLVETTLIVMVIILLFLQNWRTMIIPMITIPVSLIATLAVMKLMGFTINTLTLFGLVLAIAIVVDDAIVVVEDCERIVNDGKMTPRQAARQAMAELQGPVIGEVLVLLSVFIPTAFISGITGELYKQFALTIAVSTAFSGFNALTFTPAMCALFLKPRQASRFILYRWFNKGWAKTVGMYTMIVGRFLRKPLVASGVYVLLCIMAFWGFVKWPESYIPQEDMGYFMTSVQLPAGASEERTSQVMAEVSERLLAQPEVDDVISITGMSFLAGGSGSNLGSFFVVLKPWDERRGHDMSARSVVDRLNDELADIQAAEVFSVNPPAIPGLGLSSRLQMQLLDINNHGPVDMKRAVDEILSIARQDNRIAQINT
ncbi:MAG: efflux RND transporter permease subunit, partial [Muribaculaceae bacterium]|nr:efflux RND transporter permease subunit [Muribaculaceae bacterium]